MQLKSWGRAWDPGSVHARWPGQVRPWLPIETSIAGVPTFTGYVTDWDYTFDDGRDMDQVVGSISCELARLAELNFLDPVEVPAERTDRRLNRLLDAVGYPTTFREFDRGWTTMPPKVVEAGANMLAEAQTIARAEQGALFPDRFGRLRFGNRHHQLMRTPVAAFTDGQTGDGVTFAGITARWGAEWLALRVQTSVTDGPVWTAQGSQRERLQFGTPTFQLLDIDAQPESEMVRNLGVYWLRRRRRPEWIVTSLEVDVAAIEDSADQVAVCAVDVADWVTVSFVPGGVGEPITVTAVVQSVTHEVTEDNVRVVFELEPADTRSYYRVGDVAASSTISP